MGRRGEGRIHIGMQGWKGGWRIEDHRGGGKNKIRIRALNYVNYVKRSGEAQKEIWMYVNKFVQVIRLG